MSANRWTLHGIGGAVGIAQGAAFCYRPTNARAGASEGATTEPTGLAGFARAQERVVARLDALAVQLRAGGNEAESGIFEAQGALVLDSALHKRVSERLAAGAALPAAMTGATDEMAAMLEALDDPYLRERAADMRAVGQMLVASLGQQNDWSMLPPNTILLATDLTPAETAELPLDRVVGFATAGGGPTGHTAILARALGVPAIVGLGESVLAIENGTALILDGTASTLIINPHADDRAAAHEHSQHHVAAKARQHALRDQAGATADGHPVGLWANIGRPEEAQQALAMGAEGIGLFRSEFLFLDRAAPPSEEEQYAAYRSALAAMDGRPVVIRTIDIGGDKPLSYLPLPVEANPFLGTRGLRLCMRYPDLFRTQLRALLRAAPAGNLWIMLPMVATLDDLRWGRAQLQSAAESLAADQIAYRGDVKLGIMIETPAAVALADLFAQEADFFSIGSNDLAQYTLAVDRGAPDLAARYPANAMSVLRLIGQTTAAAKQAGIPVGLCGELGGDPDAAPLLVGLGVEEVSMTPFLLPAVKERIASITLADAQAQASAACR